MVISLFGAQYNNAKIFGLFWLVIELTRIIFPSFWLKRSLFCRFWIFTGRICRRQLCRYCFYSRADFEVFRPTGVIRCIDQGQIWQGAKFDLDRFRGGGLRPSKLKKFKFYQYNCPQGAGPLHDFYKIYRVYVPPQST